MSDFDHEKVVICRGARSDLPIVLAVHSTALGQAAGGCRMWTYRDWRDGLEDALRLSEAMTWKSALAGLPLGGGKSVIALPPGHRLDAKQRRAAMLDLGDLVESLGGMYGVAEDVGTTAHDMAVVAERTRFAYCLPEEQGGAGEPSEPTAVGVYSALKVTCEHLFGQPSVAGHRFTIVGLGQVGSRLAQRLAGENAKLAVTDIDETKHALAEELGATWVEPGQALSHSTDIVVPAALGGILTSDVVKRLDCRAVVGPANNQLDSVDVADHMEARGVLWAPDFLVNAGGVIYGALVDAQGMDPTEVLPRVEAIGDTLRHVFAEAGARGVTPYAAALKLAQERVAAARLASASSG
jgi:leucine dehydrogenase